MLRVGLTGGLASGKSFVGHALEQLGCLLIRADDLGHQVLEPGAESYQPVIDRFGRDILDDQGRINRRALAAKVFSSPDTLAELNALVHPAVRSREDALEREFFAVHPDGISVTEAAILVETGRFKDFDRLIVAACSPEQQVERAMKRDGLTRQEVLDRLSRQMPLEEKLKCADYIIDTSGPKDNTLEQTRRVFEALRQDQARRIRS